MRQAGGALAKAPLHALASLVRCRERVLEDGAAKRFNSSSSRAGTRVWMTRSFFVRLFGAVSSVMNHFVTQSETKCQSKKTLATSAA